MISVFGCSGQCTYGTVLNSWLVVYYDHKMEIESIFNMSDDSNHNEKNFLSFRFIGSARRWLRYKSTFHLSSEHVRKVRKVRHRTSRTIVDLRREKHITTAPNHCRWTEQCAVMNQAEQRKTFITFSTMVRGRTPYNCFEMFWTFRYLIGATVLCYKIRLIVKRHGHLHGTILFPVEKSSNQHVKHMFINVSSEGSGITTIQQMMYRYNSARTWVVFNFQ